MTDIPITTDNDRYHRLVAAFLAKLASEDMKIWRARRDGQDALDDPDTPMQPMVAKEVGAVKRLHLRGFQKPLPK
jgi:hypothetical protein